MHATKDKKHPLVNSYFKQDFSQSAKHTESTSLLLRLDLSKQFAEKSHRYVKNDDAFCGRIVKKCLRGRGWIKELLVHICKPQN